MLMDDNMRGAVDRDNVNRLPDWLSILGSILLPFIPRLQCITNAISRIFIFVEHTNLGKHPIRAPFSRVVNCEENLLVRHTQMEILVHDFDAVVSHLLRVGTGLRLPVEFRPEVQSDGSVQYWCDFLFEQDDVETIAPAIANALPGVFHMGKYIPPAFRRARFDRLQLKRQLDPGNVFGSRYTDELFDYKSV
jgi:hypothetical protein